MLLQILIVTKKICIFQICVFLCKGFHIKGFIYAHFSAYDASLHMMLRSSDVKKKKYLASHLKLMDVPLQIIVTFYIFLSH